MSVYRHIVSNRPDDTPLVLESGSTHTGYLFDKSAVFPSIEADIVGDAAIDGEGIEVAGELIAARVFEIPLNIYDPGSLVTGVASSQSTVLTYYENLAAMVRRIADNGGILRQRAKDLTYAIEYDIQHATLIGKAWDDDMEGGQNLDTVLRLTCRPYALGDPYDVWDDFSANTLGTAGKYNNLGSDWTRDAGTAGDQTISGGTLNVAANPTVEGRLIHTGTPRVYGDVAVMLKVTPGTSAIVNGFKAGVILKRVDALNYVEAYVDDNGVNSRVRVDIVIGGARTNVSTTNLTSRAVAGQSFWVRGVIAGNAVWADHYLPSINLLMPSYIQTTAPTNQSAWTLLTTGAQENTLGRAITGRVGITLNGQVTTTTVDDFDVRANYYAGPYTTDRKLPAEIQLPVSVPGSAPALLDATIAARASGSSAGDHGGHLFAWMPEPDVYNRVIDATSEFVTSVAWGIAIVAGVVTAAATSRSYISTLPHSGASCQQIVCPNTADSGVSQMIPGVFLAGVTYTASIWVKAASGETDQVKIKLGVSGDLATGTATALSGSWQQLSVTWRPTATRYGAFIAVVMNTAPGSTTTFEIDDAACYEGTTAPTIATSGLLPIGIIELDNGTIMTNVATAADASGSGGYVAEAAANTSQVVKTNVIAWPLRKLGRYVTVDYYALVKPGNTAAATYTLQLLDGSGGAYAEPYGSAGRTGLPESNATTRRCYYVGSLTWDTSMASQTTLQLSRLSGGNFAFGIDALFGIPVSSSSTTPTSTTTALAPLVGGAYNQGWTKRYGSDGRNQYDLDNAQHQRATLRDFNTTPFGGAGLSAPLRLFPGVKNRIMTIFSDFPLNHASHAAGSTDASISGSSSLGVQFGVRPRFYVAEPG